MRNPLDYSAYTTEELLERSDSLSRRIFALVDAYYIALYRRELLLIHQEINRRSNQEEEETC